MVYGWAELYVNWNDISMDCIHNMIISGREYNCWMRITDQEGGSFRPMLLRTAYTIIMEMKAYYRTCWQLPKY